MRRRRLQSPRWRTRRRARRCPPTPAALRDAPSANAFFVTLHATLLGVVGLVATGGSRSDDDFGRIATSCAGIVLAGAWWALLRSYRDLNAAKFRVITEMETALPAAPYTREWEL